MFKYVKEEKKTPEFNGALVKVKDHWDLFVECKESDEAKEWSRKNKQNAERKKGSPCYGARWLQDWDV